MNEEIVYVDENDKVLGVAPRKEVDAKRLRYRVSALWLVNDQEEILLARRAYTKSHHPGKWGPAVAGTVEAGESYKDNIIHETQEELGLNDIPFELGPKTKTEEGYPHFTQWFIAKVNKSAESFVIQKEEVAEVQWFSPEEVVALIKKGDEVIDSFTEEKYHLLKEKTDQLFFNRK